MTCKKCDPGNPKIKRAKRWLESCDFCKAQEGEHYCLFWGLPMKNMDLKTCECFTPLFIKEP